MENPRSMLVNSILKEPLQLNCHSVTGTKNALSLNWGSAGLSPAAAIYTAAVSGCLDFRDCSIALGGREGRLCVGDRSCEILSQDRGLEVPLPPCRCPRWQMVTDGSQVTYQNEALRIVPQHLWKAVKDRQLALESTTTKLRGALKHCGRLHRYILSSCWSAKNAAARFAA
jgi:hypothetical protein